MDKWLEESLEVLNHELEEEACLWDSLMELKESLEAAFPLMRIDLDEHGGDYSYLFNDHGFVAKIELSGDLLSEMDVYSLFDSIVELVALMVKGKN